MWLAACVLLGMPLAAPAAPELSPSTEADAEYLLTTHDLSSASMGMSVERVSDTAEALTVTTTGAVYSFERATDTLHLSQRLALPREDLTVLFPEGSFEGLTVDWQEGGAVALRAGGGALRMRINCDSLLMLHSARPLSLRYEVGFTPISYRQCREGLLLLDEYGGLGVYVATGGSAVPETTGFPHLSQELAAGDHLWLCVAPPRPYPWDESRRDRVAWHWSMDTGYPTDEQIAAWSRHANILLQQSEVMLWKDWSLRFIPRNGVEEFQRVNDTCERHGMRNIVYTSPFYFLAGTGLEDKAMNSFDNFAVTGFSPGDPRGLNWPLFLEEIRKVMARYKPDGLYFDGIYGSLVRTYLITRKTREVVGEDGIMEYHATWSPPGGDTYLPQIDTWFNFILRGEGAESSYASQDYQRYFVSTYNISNSIGVLCNNNNYPLTPQYLNQLLDNNIRLHWLLGGPDDQRTQGMEATYWPALTPALRERVEARAAERQARGAETWARLRKALAQGTEGLRGVWQEDFADPALALGSPPRPADGRPQLAPPADPQKPVLGGGWRGYMSPNSGGRLAAAEGTLRIGACSNTCAYLERELGPEVEAVQCRVRVLPDGGMSWGPGLALRLNGGMYRMTVRADANLGLDRAAGQVLYPGFPVGQWQWLRMRLLGEFLLYEVSPDGEAWKLLRTDNVGLTAGPRSLIVGKIAPDGRDVECPELWEPGACEFQQVTAYAP